MTALMALMVPCQKVTKNHKNPNIMNEVQFIADLWDYSQRYNRPETIKQFKGKFRDLVSHKIKNTYQITSDTTVITGNPREIMQMLLEDMCKVLDFEGREIMVKKRRKDLSLFRHLFIKISVDHSISTLSGIGRFLGGRDHTTMLHSYRTASHLLETKEPIIYAMFTKYVNHGDELFTKIYEKQNPNI